MGDLLFLAAIFATLTSCISVLESIVANCVEIFHTDRKKTVVVLSVIYLAASAVIVLGYSKLYFELQLPNGSVGQLLDLMDYVSNSVMMPVAALCTCFLIVKIIGFDKITAEIKRSSKFKREKIFRFCIRYLAPLFLMIILVSSIANAFGLISM